MSLDIGRTIRRLFQFHLPEVAPLIHQGIYGYRRDAGENVTRFHLRVEDDGSGLLLANASIAARLSPSGVFISKLMLEGKSPTDVKQAVHEAFRKVDSAQLDSDIVKLKQFIETLSNPEDNYPIFNLDDPSLSDPGSLMAPFHAQLTLASPKQLRPLLDKLWASGVMHVAFSAKKDSDTEDAVRNIERAEDLGMIAGIRGIGTWLEREGLMEQAALAGVDYVTVPVVSMESKVHDSHFGEGDFTRALQVFEDCRRWEICPVMEVPLLRENLQELENLIHSMDEMDIRNVLFYAVAGDYQSSGLSGAEIIQAAVHVTELATDADVRYIWQPPVSRPGSISEILESGPRTGGDVSIRVEPGGEVYAARGAFRPAGNLLQQELKQIWNSEAFRKYRERLQAPTHCEICPGLEICAADCPADPAGWVTGGER